MTALDSNSVALSYYRQGAICDGRTWQPDREPFLPRNPHAGTWDRAMSWADGQIIAGDEAWIYYGGYARGHKEDRFRERQIGLARMSLDRYVAREAGRKDGTLITRPLICEAKSMTLNASVKESLRLRILGADAMPLPGFDWDDAEPVRGDSIRLPVSWKGGRLPPAMQPIQLEFELRDARL